VPEREPSGGPTPATGGAFEAFMRMIAVLRSPEGCPWDRVQTHETLAPHLIEEAYEAVSAIESREPGAIADELGDVLLQVALHAQIASESGEFTIDDVIASIDTKIRRRHPHVFADTVAETPAEVTRNWDAIKREEKPATGALGEVPRALPALMLAQKISRRAAGAGFEWDDIDGVWEKVHEEIGEIRETQPGSQEAADEIGDLLFTVVNVARHMGIDAEAALRTTCARFVRRFEHMESAMARDGRSAGELDLAGWEELWQEAKREESAEG